MMRLFLLFLVLATGTAFAEVVRPAPEFIWRGPGGKTVSSKSLRGQAVVLLIAKSPRSGSFKGQAKRLRAVYQQFASRNVLFAAAFQQEHEAKIPSDIPFLIAENGAQLAGAYGAAGDFAIVIIGKDGNVDLNSRKILSAERVREVLINSFAIQEPQRR